MEYPIYHETLSSALHAAIAHASNSRVNISQSEVFDIFEDAIGYECTKTGNLTISELKGKPTKKYFHIVIYRLSSGRYELTCYIL